jgi:anti-sigma regulatory factor (Ser/Thr protein kinase)
LATEHLRRVHHDVASLAPVLNQCVDTILTQVKLLRRISSDFANFASSPAPTFEPTDIAALVREILDGYRLGLDARVSVTSSIADGLPALPVDRLLVGRALTNVIENALQAVASGGTVSVTVAAEAGGVVMRVADTGPGLDPATSARAFEPYFSTKMSGTGLGLPIARRNIELHGGRVDHQRSRRGRPCRSCCLAPRRRRPDPPVAGPRASVRFGRWRRAVADRRLSSAQLRPRQANEGRRQVRVRHRDERPLRMGGDRRDDDGHEDQVAVRPARTQVEVLEAAVADGADHEERGHEHHRQGQERHPAFEAIGIREHGRGRMPAAAGLASPT